MSKIKAYFQDVQSELFQKTSWPTWSELTNSAVVVMVATVIIAAVSFAIVITSYSIHYTKLYEKAFQYHVEVIQSSYQLHPLIPLPYLPIQVHRLMHLKQNLKQQENYHRQSHSYNFV